MKNVLCKIMLICFSVCLVFGSAACGKNLDLKPAELYVQGAKVASEHTFVCEDYATVSLLTALGALGFDIEWKDDRFAELTYGGREYVLDLTEKSFIEKNGTKDNVLIPAPGSDVYCFEAVERDIKLDVKFFQDVMYLLKMNVYVAWNVGESSINIRKNTDAGNW